MCASCSGRCVLQDSLGGDSKALMFCNLAPQPLHVSETLSSLAFASKVSSVVLKTPMRRVEDAAAIADAAAAEEAAPNGAYATPPSSQSTPPTGVARSASAARRSSAAR